MREVVPSASCAGRRPRDRSKHSRISAILRSQPNAPRYMWVAAAVSVLPHRWQGSNWEPSWEPFAVDDAGRLWTPMESKALGKRPECTLVDAPGHCLDIYGSGGWGFEFSRARWRSLCSSREFDVSRAR